MHTHAHRHAQTTLRTAPRVTSCILVKIDSRGSSTFSKLHPGPSLDAPLDPAEMLHLYESCHAASEAPSGVTDEMRHKQAWQGCRSAEILGPKTSSLPDRLDILLLVLIWNLVKLETVARRNRNRHPSVTETTARNQAGETLEVVRTGPSFGSPTL